MELNSVRSLKKKDWKQVSKIYAEGIATGIATFETKTPTWKKWNKKYLKPCRIVAQIDNKVAGFAMLSKISKRKVYKGVAEITIYVGDEFKGKGVGKTLLHHVITLSETHGFWTLQAAIFPENKASINLHKKCGFRLVGKREKLGQLYGKWYDNVLMERRSNNIGKDMINILILCTGNSCRSQMAHGYMSYFTDNKNVNVYSAGIETHGVNPGAIAIMKQDGIDISKHTSNHVDEFSTIKFDYIITVCDHAQENCPYIPSKNAVRLHHNFFDPSKVKGSKEEKHAAFLKARNEIKNYIESFVQQYLK